MALEQGRRASSLTTPHPRDMSSMLVQVGVSSHRPDHRHREPGGPKPADLQPRQAKRVPLPLTKRLQEPQVSTQACPHLREPVDGSRPVSSVYELSKEGILEWVAISSSRGSSRCRDRTWVPPISSTGAGGSLVSKLCDLRSHGPQTARLLCPWDYPGRNARVGCHFLLRLLRWQADSFPLRHLGSRRLRRSRFNPWVGKIP